MPFRPAVGKQTMVGRLMTNANMDRAPPAHHPEQLQRPHTQPAGHRLAATLTSQWCGCSQSNTWAKHRLWLPLLLRLQAGRQGVMHKL